MDKAISRKRKKSVTDTKGTKAFLLVTRDMLKSRTDKVKFPDTTGGDIDRELREASRP